MKRAAVYVRVSTVDQHPETQLGEVRGFAAQRLRKKDAPEDPSNRRISTARA